MQDAPGSHPATTPLLLPVIDSPTDRELVRAARAGDAFAFSRLWRRHEGAATTAASATPGRADVEQVVAAAAALTARAIRAGGGPSGAARPYVLSAVREAAATADGRAAGPVDGDPALLAPEEWYDEALPAGMRDARAVATAYASLPVAAQEALWLAEVEGHGEAEIAAELALTLPSAEGLLVEARTGLDAAWADAVAATVPEDSECARVLARRSLGDRATEHLRPKVRAHLDACATCRAASAEPAVLARRLMATLPVLVLGAAAGTAFLDAVRPGSSAVALEPVPALDDHAAGAGFLFAASTAAATTPVTMPAPGPAGRRGSASAATAVGVVRLPRRRVLAVGAALAGAAAAAAIVTVIALSAAGPSATTGSLEASGSTDVAEQAPGMQPPVVVASEIPGEPDAGTDPGDDPGPNDGDSTPPAGSESGEPGTDASGPVAEPAPAPGSPAEPSPTEPAPGDVTDPSTPPAAPRPPEPEPVSAPQPPTNAPPIEVGFGKPTSAGWRTMTLTGAPGASYTVLNGGEVLYTGVLDANGTAELAVRGSTVRLTVEYGTLALTAASTGQ
ncbi:hypothetical protein ACFPER_06085 [Agromyces aurantiacus]|uniref:Sigma-70 family RNA polymerase sigma factor n=1 Tax=Agromyces aurantiacus TaxID=165814 RepID=A0ABV9R2Z8_9MICO|nr:hypothetical protein [Agromyces aurantiacus]MBM7503031.1 DNA-directed RNA polymerase specialized sigma24 family protein [Agromyces aurantiacus]